jgi:ComF family protein
MLMGVFLRFLFPWACAGCRTPLETLEDSGFCGECWLDLPRIQDLVCRSCGIPLKEGGSLCFACRQEPLRLMVRAAVSYNGPIASAVHRFKYTGRKSLAGPFGTLLRYAWHQFPELQPVDTLIPVPLHRSVQRQRGFNQAQILAMALSQWVNCPVLKGALIRTRRTRPQYKLSRPERRQNMREAIALVRTREGTFAAKGRHILLIDDVCTTGATLQSCATALRRAGAASVKALVLARDL